MVGKTNTWLNRVGSNDAGKLHAPNTAGHKQIGTTRHGMATARHGIGAVAPHIISRHITAHVVVEVSANHWKDVR